MRYLRMFENFFNKGYYKGGQVSRIVVNRLDDNSALIVVHKLDNTKSVNFVAQDLSNHDRDRIIEYFGLQPSSQANINYMLLRRNDILILLLTEYEVRREETSFNQIKIWSLLDEYYLVETESMTRENYYEFWICDELDGLFEMLQSETFLSSLKSSFRN